MPGGSGRVGTRARGRRLLSRRARDCETGTRYALLCLFIGFFPLRAASELGPSADHPCTERLW